ncbi:MAG: hypothetical protein LBB45_01705 [Methanobrevibacter sp.]|jgi:hypothetical protein|nr:hypothetical protein [Candidatus Methanovirga basalitermitum]
MGWNPKKSDYTSQDGKISWCNACLYKQDGCKLPVKNPDGTYNRQGLISAFKMVGHVKGISQGEVNNIKSKIAKLLLSEFDDDQYKDGSKSVLSGTVMDDTNLFSVYNRTTQHTKETMHGALDKLNGAPIPLKVSHHCFIPDDETDKLINDTGLLEVGQILDYHLEDYEDGTKSRIIIDEAEIHNPKILEKYNNGELQGLSTEFYYMPTLNPDTDIFETIDLTYSSVSIVDSPACKQCAIKSNPKNINENNSKVYINKPIKIDLIEHVKDNEIRCSLPNCKECESAILNNMNIPTNNKNNKEMLKSMKNSNTPVEPVVEEPKQIDSEPQENEDNDDDLESRFNDLESRFDKLEEVVHDALEHFKVNEAPQVEGAKSINFKELVAKTKEATKQAILDDANAENYVDGLISSGIVLPAQKTAHYNHVKNIGLSAYKSLFPTTAKPQVELGKKSVETSKNDEEVYKLEPTFGEIQ